ncbi:MAG TPA: hypothetical protein VGC72_16800 [Candidatus Elarobacter sp.]|jgi:pimeloyl-ACP methyl ester carboxylesterase
MGQTDPLTAQRQIMLSLAYLAYAGELLPPFPSPDAQIAVLVDDGLTDTTQYPTIANEWTRVWGPVTWTVPGASGQDNMMYVAKTTPASQLVQYAVAVRGTNGKVYLDWLIEDFDISPMVPWIVGGTTQAGSISESTNIGITILQQMVDATSQQTLFAFLAAEIQALPGGTTAAVHFVGHSLGAAISSALALHARDQQPAWDPNEAATVTCTNFAGPTAGDAAYASYLETAFAIGGTAPAWWTSPQTTSPSFADFVRQPLDVAPLGWNETTMATVPDLYDGIGVNLGWGDWSVAQGVLGIIDYFIGSNGYTQPFASAPQLTPMSDPDIPANPPEGFETFAEEAEWQHSTSYPTILGCASILGSETMPPVVKRLRVASARAR